MKPLPILLPFALFSLLEIFISAQLQPVRPPLDVFRPPTGNDVSNLRVTHQSPDGTEVVLTMDCSYDGLSGPSALLIPIIEKRNAKRSIRSWFGADPVIVGQGRAPVSIKLKFFNDEEGVPSTVTSDLVHIQLYNVTGTAQLRSIPFLKTIHWGSKTATPQPAPPPRSTVQARSQPQLQTQPQAPKPRTQPQLDAQAQAAPRRSPQTRTAPETQPAPATRQPAESSVARIDKPQPSVSTKAASESAQAKTTPREKVTAATPPQTAPNRVTSAPKQAEPPIASVPEPKTPPLLARATSDRPSSSRPVAPRPQEPTLTRASEAELRNIKTKIINVDVVNRVIDRTQMLIGIEFDYRDRFNPKPMLGIEVLRSDDPSVSAYFQSKPMPLSGSRRNFMLFPVKFDPPEHLRSTEFFSTDKVLVYLIDSATQKRFDLFPATFLLKWRVPGAEPPAGETQESGDGLELEEVRQSEPHLAYLTIRYRLNSGVGMVRAHVFDSKSPSSAAWFVSDPQPATAPGGVRVIELGLQRNAETPANSVRTDRLVLELLDSSGRVIASQAAPWEMEWTKPE